MASKNSLSVHGETNFDFWLALLLGWQRRYTCSNRRQFLDFWGSLFQNSRKIVNRSVRLWQRRTFRVPTMEPTSTSPCLLLNLLLESLECLNQESPLRDPPHFILASKRILVFYRYP
jgi:hypothetical protein